MTLVHIRNRGASWMGDLDVVRTWQLAPLGAGSATFSVPLYDQRTGLRHALASATYLDPYGGSYVAIADEFGSGIWIGVTAPTVWNQSGAQITAYQPWRILSRRRVGSRTYRNVQAGLIVRDALRVGLAGVPGMQLPADSFDGSGPLIAAYAFAGQDVQSIINDVSLQTGLALAIDAATGTVRFGAPVETYQPGFWIAGSDVLQWSYALDPSSMSGMVTVSPDAFGGHTQRAVNGVAAAQNWPTQDTADSSGVAGWPALRTALGAAADASRPAATFTGVLPERYRNAREGDVRRILAPLAEWSGRVVTAQITSRTLQSRSLTMGVTFALLERFADDPIVQRSGPQIRNPYRRAAKILPWRVVDLERAVERLQR